MRLSPVVPTLAGLLFAWAVAAQADAPPPAAPIFYCPSPGKAAASTPGKAPVKPAAPTVAPMVHASAPRPQGCPTMRVAAEHHHWRREERHFAVAPPPAPVPAAHHRYVADADVSAAQAFIYRYERAVHGLDAGAADQAWAEGRRGPPMGGRFLAQRETPPPPPCPHGCPGPEAWRHAGAPPMMAERAPPPPMAQRAPPPPMPGPQARAYAWQDGHAGGGYSIQRSESAGGWSYREQDGQGHYHQWGDHFPGEPGHGWAGHGDDHGQRWAEGPPRGPCPHACPGGPHGHAEVYETAGRDAAGFLTWPGKTPGW